MHRPLDEQTINIIIHDEINLSVFFSFFFRVSSINRDRQSAGVFEWTNVNDCGETPTIQNAFARLAFSCRLIDYAVEGIRGNQKFIFAIATKSSQRWQNDCNNSGYQMLFRGRCMYFSSTRIIWFNESTHSRYGQRCWPLQRVAKGLATFNCPAIVQPTTNFRWKFIFGTTKKRKRYDDEDDGEHDAEVVSF